MNKSMSWVLAVTLLLSASASAATLARTSGAFGILTYDPAPARTWEHIDTWCGGGSDNFATTDANWESGEAPDITSNDLLAIFATGGSEALLPAGTAAAFAGIVLDGAKLDGDRFEFTAGSGATATIGECALTVSNAPSATTWTIHWPLTLRDFAQTWTIGANNTVEFDAPIDGEQDLVFAGSGTAKLNASSTRSGLLKVTSGTLWIDASWENCTNLVLAGGTFVVKNGNAFGDEGRAPGEAPKVQVEVTSGASLVLHYGGQIDCSAFRVDGVSLRGTIGSPGSGADNEYAWISGPGLMHVWGYADWAAANGVSGAWDETDALGVHNVFRYAFDKPTGAFDDPPLLDLAIEGGNAVVKTPPVANTEGFTVSVVESSDVAGAAVTRRKPLDATGRTEFPMGDAASRFYRLSATEGDAEPDLGGVQLWENGPCWAECNVGATAPEESGYYFWWGDTVGYIRSGGTWMSWGIYLGVTWVSSTGEQMSSSR